MNIGILDLKENFFKHAELIKRCNATPINIINNFKNIDGLIISGEILKEKNFNLYNKIIYYVKSGIPIFVISEAIEILIKLNLLEVKIKIFNNKYFEKEIFIPALGEKPFKVVFKKNIYIKKVAPNVGILSQLDDGKIIFVRQGNYLACTFQPELTEDLRIYMYFIKMVKDELKFKKNS